MKEQNKLNLKQMQELFCDYAFHRLNQTERELFEANIDRFPEMKQELQDVNHVFSKVDNMDIDKKISQHTRNLSVKIHKRLYEKQSIQRKSSLVTKILAPTLGLAAIVILFISLDFNDNIEIKNPSAEINQEGIVNISSTDINSIISENTIDSTIFQITTDFNSNISANSSESIAFVDEELLNTMYEETFNDFFGSTETIDSPSISEFDLYDQLEHMNEDDFQNLLEELENAKISS